MLIARQQRGVTLLELMIGLGIVAFLLAVGAPSYTQFMQSSKTRAGAESLVKGLTLARNEAIFRKRNVRFDIVSDTGVLSWTVGCVNVKTDCPAVIRKYDVVESDGNARVGASVTPPPAALPADYYTTAIAAGTELPTGVTFNGLGRVTALAGDDSITRLDVTTVATSNVKGRRYVVTVPASGAARMCDPTFTISANPQGC